MDRPVQSTAASIAQPLPMFAMGYDQLDWIDMAALRRNSRQLWEFVEHDHHSLAQEIQAAFPNQDGTAIRPVPICAAYANEVATLYRDAVYREFVGFDADQRTKISAIYENSDVTGFLDRVQHHLALQRTMIIAVVPDRVDRVKLMSWCVFEAQVQTGAGPDVADIEAATGVTLRWPYGSFDDQVTLFGYAFFSPTDAYLVGNGGRSPFFGGGSEKHPFGRVPLIAARLGEPKKGRFWSPLEDSLLAQEIAASLAETDAEIVLQHQGHGQKVVTAGSENGLPQSMVDALPVGPNRILGLQAPGSEYKIVQGQVPVEQHVKLQEARLKNVATLHGISPSKFMRENTAMTQLSRDSDRLDREDLNRPQKREFARIERAILRLICEQSVFYGDPVPLPVPDGKNGVDVVVRWPEYSPPADALRSAQADAILDQTGEDSVVDRVAFRANVSRAAALAMVKRRLGELVDLEAVRGRAAPMAGTSLVKESLADAPGAEDTTPAAMSSNGGAMAPAKPGAAGS